ncbi:SagB/ThcOx family dehydrogenase [candidate division KSB1 bacterium]|nr:SagB/ThcOx family dehydrogenase [candidate division KSB1 bacterium]
MKSFFAPGRGVDSNFKYIGWGMSLLFISTLILAQNKVNPRIKLPQPSKSGTCAVEKAIAGRRSIRNFSDQPISQAELGQLLWAAQGITAVGGLRTAPSAGALYPLELYVVAGQVKGLTPGIYHYQPAAHELEPIIAGDSRQTVAAAARGQNCLKISAVIVVISAVFARTTVKYGERGVRYVHLEAGHAAQNICLQAVALNLGTTVIGAFHDTEVQQVLHLSSEVAPLALIPVGKKIDHE